FWLVRRVELKGAILVVPFVSKEIMVVPENDLPDASRLQLTLSVRPRNDFPISLEQLEIGFASDFFFAVSVPLLEQNHCTRGRRFYLVWAGPRSQLVALAEAVLS